MGPRALTRSGGKPLWGQLQDDLLRRIRVHDFDGGAFPGELALMDQYAVSRHTVRQALAQLRADGIVVAERGRAPRIGSPGPPPGIDQPVGEVYSLFTSVEESGRAQRSVVRRLERVADGVVASRLGLEESTPLLLLERLRLADDEPLAWDRVWLPFADAEPLVGADLTHTALYAELAARTGLRVDGGRERIHAEVADEAVGPLLDVPSGAPVFRIARLGTAAERPVEWRQTLIRADRFHLTADFGARPASWSIQRDDVPLGGHR
ncbi:GntR family transcriptional regulator [Actinomycetospora atypica]|uniref:GntR family transcriptional regulator n=1 Tax=Actinomycetospora atypica TaxID=1290095 RepID=A0ABV9YQV1_9PSEU